MEQHGENLYNDDRVNWKNSLVGGEKDRRKSGIAGKDTGEDGIF